MCFHGKQVQSTLLLSGRHVQTSLADSKPMLACVSYFLLTIKKVEKTGPVGALNALVRAPKVRSILCTEHVQITPVDSKLKFADVSYGLVTVKNGTKTSSVGALNAPVHALKVRLVFSHKKCPIHLGGLEIQVCTCILYSGHHKKGQKTGPVGTLNALVRVPKVRLFFCTEHV